MNKNIKQLIESLFDEETDNMLASDKDSINNTFAEKITGITIGKDHIIYEAVDLDLPSGNLWCDRNIGATRPTKTGGYFRRKGFTLDKISLDSAAGINWDSYVELLYSRLKNKTIKYKSVPEFILGAEWDVPSKKDIEELINNTNVSQIQVEKNGIAFKVSSLKNHNKFIIIPSTGYIKGKKVQDKTDACFWSSTEYDGYDFNYGYKILNANMVGIGITAYDMLSSLPIRAIRKK